jgi:iron complex outermembrane receptor protein
MDISHHFMKLSSPIEKAETTMCVIKYTVLAIALTAFSTTAHAQRASENVVTSAQDAFGTSIGDDSIGLYSSTNARGFSPQDAGNIRIEGLFFDQLTRGFGFGSQLVKSTTMRVGLSAQSYPAPAPTGIADVRLRLPGDKILVGASSFYGGYSSYGGQADLELPIISKKLGAVLGVAGGHTDLDGGGGFEYLDASGLLHWTPTTSSELIAFYQRSEPQNGTGTPPGVITAGAFLPPKIDRGNFFGPDFDQNRHRIQTNIGVIGRSVVFSNWRLQAGLFRSVNDLENFFFMLYSGTQPDGTASLNIRTRPPAWIGSFSGEVRASGQYADGPRRHTFHISAKGRLGKRTFGGDDTLSFGSTMIGVRVPITKPTGFSFGPQSRDKIRHGTAGVTYVGQWAGVGEVSAGIQKAVYRRAVDQFGPTLTTTRTNPWLYNGTLAIEGGDNLTFYGSYTRGLEDSGIAPESAANPGEALAASLTEQIDAGLRYKITPDITLVAGVFEVKKPYFDRDPTNVYARVGALRHRGVEVSLSGKPIEGLKIVAGAVLLQARVSGSTVDLGLIGDVPPGETPVLLRLNANYGPTAWRGFSLNAKVNFEDSHNANRLNTVRISSITTVDLGARYNFKVYDTSASLRFDVRNATNAFAWKVGGASGIYTPLAPRKYIARVAAEF